MKYSITVSVAALVSLCAPAWAMNKCTGADGKISFQDVPCPGKGEKIEVRPNSGLVFQTSVPAKPPVAVEAPAPSAWPALATQQQNPAKSPLAQEADECLDWYKPKLRDPAGAYYSEAAKDGRVVSITVHATNGYGGYVKKDAACEFYNSRLDADWTKIHASRRGW